VGILIEMTRLLRFGIKDARRYFPARCPADVLNGFVKFQRESATAEVAANMLSLTYSLDVVEYLPTAPGMFNAVNITRFSD